MERSDKEVTSSCPYAIVALMGTLDKNKRVDILVLTNDAIQNSGAEMFIKDLDKLHFSTYFQVVQLTSNHRGRLLCKTTSNTKIIEVDEGKSNELIAKQITELFYSGRFLTYNRSLVKRRAYEQLYWRDEPIRSVQIYWSCLALFYISYFTFKK